jgi:mono/diheme cytochrome c family protein
MDAGAPTPCAGQEPSTIHETACRLPPTNQQRTYSMMSSKTLGRIVRHVPVSLGWCALLTSAPTALLAQPHSPAPTYTKHVAAILYKNCTTCHRPGGIGPMSLMTYDDVTLAAGELGEAVTTGYMPPWHADGPRGRFTNDRRLSEADKATLAAWVQAGLPKGDSIDLPPAPVYSPEWNVGTPDLVLEMPQPFEVPAAGTIEYQYIEIPTNLSEDKWVRAIEILPGAREVVHHVIVYARGPAPATPSAPPPPRPAGVAAPKPVFSFRSDHDVPTSPSDSTRPRQTGPMIAAMAPGTEVQTFPAGTALRLRAGSVLTLQMHYTAHGHAMKDQSKVGIVFASEPPEEEIRAGAFSNGAFTLPAGAANVAVPSELGVNEPVKIWGMLPHTHLRGKRWEYRLTHPDGRTEPVLSVPNYDFNWQTYYMFATPLSMPAGAKLEATAWYDNSAANPSNPDPKIDVKWGDQTWEEMQFTAFLFTIDSRRLRPPAAKP